MWESRMDSKDEDASTLRRHIDSLSVAGALSRIIRTNAISRTLPARSHKHPRRIREKVLLLAPAEYKTLRKSVSEP